MTYVEATIHEGMRVRPVIPMIVRMVNRRWRFGDYVVPAHTPVAVNIVALHHRDDVYPEPHRFAPERFLERKPGTYTWIPFGGGIRRCLGASLAMAEQRVVLRAIARRTDLVAPRPGARTGAPAKRHDDPARGGRVVVQRKLPAVSPPIARYRHAVATHGTPDATTARDAASGASDRRDGGVDRGARATATRPSPTSFGIARTSRRTFYEHFEDREACFLALFDAVNDETMDRIAAAVTPGGADGRAGRPRARGLHRQRYLAPGALPELRPRASRRSGEPGSDRGLAVVERFARLLIGLVESGRAAQPELEARPLSMDAAVMIVGGLRELAVISLQQGRDLRELPASAGAMVKAILSGALL